MTSATASSPSRNLCACGSPLPAIRPEGRRDDVLALRAMDGSIVRLSPLALTTVVEDASPGSRFQLVQTDADRITVRLCADSQRIRRAQWQATRKALRGDPVQQSLDNVRVSLAAGEPFPTREAASFVK